MAFGTYKQYDSRWGSKNYNGSSNYSQAACGPTSCANILYAIDPSITPLTTGKFMQDNGYAIRNNGTAWNGIPACLKHFGAKEVQSVDVSSSMTKVWELMKEGFVGVFLFRAGTRSNITWTTSGHYLAVQGYKYENNKHYLKMMDSGGRDHDGWYCYETQMKGLIPRVWLCKVERNGNKSSYKPTKPYTGETPSKSAQYGTKDNVAVMTFLNWILGINLGKDGNFGPKSEQAIYDFQATYDLEQDGIFGTKCIAKSKELISQYAVKGTHKFGHCASRALDCVEEKFKYSTKTSSAYNWRFVAVWKDEAMAEKCAEFAEQCNKRKPKIQYDDKPNLKSKLIKNKGKMPSGSLTGNCSNYVLACCYYASGKNILDYGAKNLRREMQKTDLFKFYDNGEQKGYMQRGAIYGSGHHCGVSLGMK